MRKDVFESLTALARQRYPADEVHAFGAVRRTAVAAGDAAAGASARSALRLVGGGAARLARSRAREPAGRVQANCDAARGASSNTLHMRHPLSSALPFAARWLDMPAQPLPGDAQMPRVQGAAFGASRATGRVAGPGSAGLFPDAGRPGRSSAVAVLRCGPRGVGARRADAAAAGRTRSTR